MAKQIVLFGATGYTGHLTAEAMLKRHCRPLLAGRNQISLKILAERLGGLNFRLADITRPASLRDLVEPGDILLTTVGPFGRYGKEVLDAAIEKGAHYIDSTGEPNFIKHVYSKHDAAVKAGVTLLTAAGYDYFPGNCAAAAALQMAGENAVRVDVGYFIAGGGPLPMSQGTLASTLSTAAERGLEFRNKKWLENFGGERLRRFKLANKELPAISVPSSENIFLPRSFPQLEEVNCYLGWFGLSSYALMPFSRLQYFITRFPGYSFVLDKLLSPLTRSDGQGPDAQKRAKSGSHIIAITYDKQGNELTKAELIGIDTYSFTANILAWTAEQVFQGNISGPGALGPVEAFGLERLVEGIRQAGLELTLS